MKRKGFRKVLNILLVIVGLIVLLVGLGLALTWTRLGGTLAGERLERAKTSANFRDGKFLNPIPTDNSWGLAKMWRTYKLYQGDRQSVPNGQPPVDHPAQESLRTPPVSGLRVTWLGHSTVLIEIDSQTILLDPVFAERSSPLSFMGPKRFHPAPVSIADLPPIDAVIVSHDHYDHLDYDAIVGLAPKTKAFYVPLGVGTHLDYWKIPPDKIIELDWWEESETRGGLRLIACPARHFSGRMGFGDNTQWSSWSIIGPAHRVFFSGDTGPLPLFDEVGRRHGPFDVSLVKIGAYGDTWPDIHIDPEQGVEVHRQVNAELMIPIHWGTFNLSYHSWTEPVERLLTAAKKSGVQTAVPRPGQAVEPGDPPSLERWWETVND